MSNLSELLPSGGGGQNEVDFIASGTLSSGQAVALKTDGTVVPIASTTGNITNYAESSAASTTGTEEILRYDSFNNKVLYFYRNNAGYPTAVVGSISGNTIAFGTPTIANSSYRDHIAADVTTGQYADGKGIMTMIYSGDATLYATQFTVSGSSISFSNILYVYYPAHTGYGRAIAVENCPTQGNFVCTYLDQWTGQGYALPISVGGSSPNIYGASAFDSSASFPNSMDMAWDSANQKMVMSYKYQNRTGKTVVITVGGSSLSYGTPTQHASPAVETQAVTYDSAAGKVLIVYSNDSNILYGRVGTVSGTSISFGTATAIYNATSGSTEYDVCYDSVNQRCIVSFRKNAAPNSQYCFIAAIQISGTGFSVGTDVVFRAANGQYITNVYDPIAERVVTGYRDTGNTNQPYTVLSSVQTSNASDFIGITASAIANTATGTVNVYGGINEAQSGLASGSDYYVQSNGSLSTTESNIKAGRAISATTINMVDLIL